MHFMFKRKELLKRSIFQSDLTVSFPTAARTASGWREKGLVLRAGAAVLLQWSVS